MPAIKVERKQDVLKQLRKHGNISRAANRVMVSRKTIYRWLENDPVFRAAAEAAIKEALK